VSTHPAVRFAYLTVFLDLLGFGIVLPLLPFYVSAMGGSPESLGLLLGCFSLTQLIATPILGRISDRFGRRRVILVSLAGNAISMVAFALASKLLWLPLLFVSRIVAGATAGNIAACQASISDVTKADDRAIAMGRLGASINLGVIVGPLFAGAISGFGTWVPPLAAGALAFVDLGAAYFFMPETIHLGSSTPAVARRPSAFGELWHWSILSLLLMYALCFLGLTNIQVALALLAKHKLDWGPREVAWLFAVFATASFVVQGLLIGRLTRRFGEKRLVVASSACSALGLLLVGEAPSAAVLLAGVALFGAGFGATAPVLTSLASQATRDDTRGFTLGVLQSSGGLARTIGPLFGGILFHRVRPDAPFLVGVAAALGSMVLAITLRANKAAASS